MSGRVCAVCVLEVVSLHHRHMLLWRDFPYMCAPQHPTRSKCFATSYDEGQMYKVVSSAKMFLLFLWMFCVKISEYYKLRCMVIIVKYYQYNGFLFINQFEID